MNKKMSHVCIENNMVPTYIQFYPTLRCNYSCHFCFNRNLSLTNDVEVHEFEKIISISKALGIEYVDMLGGEPTLHPNFLQLVEIIHSYGLKTTVSSNGTRVPLLSALSEKYPKEFVKIGISVNTDILSEDLHEYILGYRPVVKSIFSIQSNFPKPCEQYVGLPGIEYFLLYLDITDNSGLEHSVPFYVFHRKLLRLKQTFKGLEGVFCSGFIPDTETYPVLESVRCPAGTTKLSLLPNGAVYPCYLFFRYKEFELGNILRDDFKKIWQNPILDYFRHFNKNTCPKTSCRLFNSCHGGCPAMSYAFYNDLNLPDPRCG
jgi:radical SAM protein with 4Fe4S-binding SPASM domain